MQGILSQLKQVIHEKSLRHFVIVVSCFCLFIALPFPVFAGPNGITGFIYNMCIGVGGFFLWIGGYILDNAISMLVIEMGTQLRTGGIGVAIDNVWVVIRDIFNLLFIFGLIYIGFQTILKAGDTNTRKLLVSLIGAALLINFSLYFTKAIVDFTNVAAFQIYELMNVVEEDTGHKGISGAFMQYAKIQSYADANNDLLEKSAADDSNFSNMRFIGFGFMMMIFMLIAAFVFIAGGILLVIRFVALILYMIASPAMFLGWVFPQLGSYTSRWWQGFISYALVAPVFLFMIYLSLSVLSKLQIDGSFADIMDSSVNSGAFQILIYFFVIIALMIASLLVSKQLGVVGANQAINIGQTLRRSAQGFAGRNSIGRVSNWTQNRFTRWQERPPEQQSRIGRAMRNGLATTNLDRTIINTTDRGRNARFGSGSSLRENQEYAQARQRRLVSGADTQRRENQIVDTTEMLRNNPRAVTGDAMRDLTNSIRNLSQRQLTEDITFETLTNQNVAVHLSDAQLTTIRDSGRFSDQQVGEIRGAREQGFTNISQNIPGPHNVANQHRNPQWLSTRSTQQMTQMPPAVFAAPQMANYITPNIIDARLREGGINDADLQRIRDNLQTYLNPVAIHATRPAGMATPTPAIVDNWRIWTQQSAFANRLGLIL